MALVLGCTELPLLFETMQLPVPTIDVMRVHIDALIGVVLG
jgi:aspartate racemase